jgi:hypothetical protein
MAIDCNLGEILQVDYNTWAGKHKGAWIWEVTEATDSKLSSEEPQNIQRFRDASRSLQNGDTSRYQPACFLPIDPC